MAKIVFGAGTSHTPMLLASDETLPRFQETDRNIKHRDKEGRPVTYGDLLEKADPKLAHLVAPEQLVARQNVARTAARHLREAVAAARLDALIVMGDDQNESYLEDCRPAFAVYYGDTIRNNATQHHTYSHYPEWYVKNRQGFFEPGQPRDYPVHSGLATHLIETLMDDGFDLASSKRLPEGDGEGHALAYVHRHVIDEADPVPVVPIFLNTYFPPNQPRPKRCHQFGQAVRRAVEGFAGDARVGVLAIRGPEPFPGRRGVRPRHPESARRQGRGVPAKPAAQQAQRRQLGDPQLGRACGRGRPSRSHLVRIRAGLSHARRHRHRLELRDAGVRGCMGCGRASPAHADTNAGGDGQCFTFAHPTALRAARSGERSVRPNPQ